MLLKTFPGPFVRTALASLAGAALFAPQLKARQIDIQIDLEMATQLLNQSCSNIPVEYDLWASSPALQAQLRHHAEFGERFSLQNYIAGLESASACQVPSPDPFRFSSLVSRRDQMRHAINYLSEKSTILGGRVSRHLAPYVPEGFTYQGSVIFAAASFSCGGFQNGDAFFVDIPCIAGNIEEEFDAITMLTTHETYHAMQAHFAYPTSIRLSEIDTVQKAHDFMFERLAWEGSASHIGNMLEIEGEGRYASFSRSLAKRNFQQLEYNFDLFDMMIEAVAASPSDVEERFPTIYGLAFDGAFDQRAYFVGQQVTAELEHSYGAASVPCLLQMPYENYVLAYDDALQDGDNLPKSVPFAQTTLAVAKKRQTERRSSLDYRVCIPEY